MKSRREWAASTARGTSTMVSGSSAKTLGLRGRGGGGGRAGFASGSGSGWGSGGDAGACASSATAGSGGAVSSGGGAPLRSGSSIAAPPNPHRPAHDHRATGVPTVGDDQDDVRDHEPAEHDHAHKMDDARAIVVHEQPLEPAQLRRLVHGPSRGHDQDPENRHREIGATLERVVLGAHFGMRPGPTQDGH